MPSPRHRRVLVSWKRALAKQCFGLLSAAVLSCGREEPGDWVETFDCVGRCGWVLLSGAPTQVRFGETLAGQRGVELRGLGVVVGKRFAAWATDESALLTATVRCEPGTLVDLAVLDEQRLLKEPLFGSQLTTTGSWRLLILPLTRERVPAGAEIAHELVLGLVGGPGPCEIDDLAIEF